MAEWMRFSLRGQLKPVAECVLFREAGGWQGVAKPRKAREILAQGGA